MTNHFGIGMYVDSQCDVNMTCGIGIGIMLAKLATPSGQRMPGNMPERHSNLESPCHFYQHANKVAGHRHFGTRPQEEHAGDDAKDTDELGTGMSLMMPKTLMKLEPGMFPYEARRTCQ